MANSFEVTVEIDVPPDDVWAVLGNPADMGWFPPVATAHVEGATRYVTMGDGRTLVERLVDRDDAARTYAYSVVAGSSAKMRSHRASFRVDELDAGGSRVVWRTDAVLDDPDVDLEARLGPPMRAGLEALKLQLEAGREVGAG